MKLSDALYCIIAYTYGLCANTYKLASFQAEQESFLVSAGARHDAYNWNIPVFPVPSIKATAAAAVLYFLLSSGECRAPACERLSD